MKIIHGRDMSPGGVPHNPSLLKTVYLRNGDLPALTQLARATFEPAQSCPIHDHPTMYEVFCIEEGKAESTVSGETFVVEPGDCIVIEPGERHAQRNPFDAPVRMLYFGIATAVKG